MVRLGVVQERGDADGAVEFRIFEALRTVILVSLHHDMKNS